MNGVELTTKTRLIPTRASVLTAVVLSYTPPLLYFPPYRPETLEPSGTNGKDYGHGTLAWSPTPASCAFLAFELQDENNTICHVF
jgi:hypothetical protein